MSFRMLDLDPKNTYSESEHRNLPNLLNNTVSYDKIRERSMNETPDDHDNNHHADTNNDKNIVENIIKNLDNLKTTETDMMFGYFANNEKLVSEDKIRDYSKQDRSDDHDRDHDRHSDHHDSDRKRTESSDSDKHKSRSKHESETIGDYLKSKKPDDHHDSNSKGGTAGPSYGDGPSNRDSHDTTSDDPYYGFGSKDELDLAKLDMLRKLGELMNYGIKLSQNYNMKSDYKAMKYEYDLHCSIRSKNNGVRWMSNAFLNIIWGIELANEQFNPFDFKLTNWTEQMNEDIPEYYEVMGELYEKYFKSGASIPPELKLIGMVGASAVKFHVAQSSINRIPSLDEAMRANPNLMNNLNEQVINGGYNQANQANQANNQADKTREIFNKKDEINHDIARRKADELRMLKEKQNEYDNMRQSMMQQQMNQNQMMQHEILEKQRQLEDLQRQLNAQRSDCMSSYTGGDMGQISNGNKKPASVRRRVVNKEYQYSGNGSVGSNRSNQQNGYSKQDAVYQQRQQQQQQQPTMKRPVLPASLRNRAKPGLVVNTGPSYQNDYNDPKPKSRSNSGKRSRGSVSIDTVSIDKNLDDIIANTLNVDSMSVSTKSTKH